MFDATPRLGHHEAALLKGALAGLLGGLVASWVMSRFQAAVPAEAFQKLLGESAGGEGGSSKSGESGDDGSDAGESDETSSEPATVRAAEAVSEVALGHELEEREKAWAGPAVHYGFGGMNGVIYGTLAEVAPRVTVGGGIPFGTVVWLVADEGAVPAVGLSKAPWKYPLSTHVYSLASHFVYGLSLETTRRLVRRVL